MHSFGFSMTSRKLGSKRKSGKNEVNTKKTKTSGNILKAFFSQPKKHFSKLKENENNVISLLSDDEDDSFLYSEVEKLEENIILKKESTSDLNTELLQTKHLMLDKENNEAVASETKIFRDEETKNEFDNIKKKVETPQNEKGGELSLNEKEGEWSLNGSEASLKEENIAFNDGSYLVHFKTILLLITKDSFYENLFNSQDRQIVNTFLNKLHGLNRAFRFFENIRKITQTFFKNQQRG